jgi:hypothetical protein
VEAYSYALGDEAVRAFTTLNVRRRGKLLRAFDLLARVPAGHGDFQEFGESGHIYEIKLIDDMIITWWVDDAVREIRILRIERVE